MLDAIMKPDMLEHCVHFHFIFRTFVSVWKGGAFPAETWRVGPAITGF